MFFASCWVRVLPPSASERVRRSVHSARTMAEAAEGYFGKTPAELTSAECVLLAGLPNAPSAYSPHSSPELALKRSQVVLDRMVSCKKLTKTQARELQDEIAALPVLART